MSRVLIVDDESEGCEGLSSVLAQAGCSVRAFTNGTAAIEWFRRERADLVFCDLKLPGPDGLEVLGALKGIDPWATVIIVTAYGTIETATRAMRLGAYDFIEKPLTVSQTQQVTRRALEHRRRLKDLTRLQGRPGSAADIPARLMELEQLRAEFLHLMIQELRTPIKLLSENLTLAQQGFYGPWSPRHRPFLNQVSRVHALISRTLIGSLAFFLSHEQRVSPALGNLIPMIREILREAEERCRQRGLTLKAALPSDPSVGWMDAEKLSWIARELLDNAIRFTPSGGEIEVRLELQDSSGILLRVSDTGCGIREEERKWLFTTFRPPQPGSSNPWKKTTLGLVLVRHFVDLLKGTIEVEGRPGSGTRFSVTLPWRESSSDEKGVSSGTPGR